MGGVQTKRVEQPLSFPLPKSRPWWARCTYVGSGAPVGLPRAGNGDHGPHWATRWSPGTSSGLWVKALSPAMRVQLSEKPGSEPPRGYSGGLWTEGCLVAWDLGANGRTDGGILTRVQAARKRDQPGFYPGHHHYLARWPQAHGFSGPWRPGL